MISHIQGSIVSYAAIVWLVTQQKTAVQEPRDSTTKNNAIRLQSQVFCEQIVNRVEHI